MAFPAAAQGPRRFEVGASLLNLMVVIPDQEDKGVFFGVPSGGVGLLSPSVYAAVFVAPRFAIEPQVGLLVISSGGRTSHVANIAGQVDYFVNGAAVTSSYVFGAVLDMVSNSDTAQAGERVYIASASRQACSQDRRSLHISPTARAMLGFQPLNRRNIWS